MNTTGALSQNLVEVIGALLQAESREEACSVIERRAAQRGYENVIICNSEHALHHCNVPHGWFDHYFNDGLYQNDLILRALKSLAAPHYWRDVPEILDASKKECDFVAESRLAGLRDGISVAGIAGGQPLITTFSARDRGVEDDGALEEFVALVGVYGFLQHRFECPGDYGLTRTEMELLPWLASGLNIEQIADGRCRAADTVKSQVKSIYSKLRKHEPGISNRTTLVAFCISRGLLRLDQL